MTRQNLELILGLFKEGQIGEKEAADLIEDLQAEDIYVYEGKDGRKPTIMFYRKEK